MRERGIEGVRKACRTTLSGPISALAPDLVRRDFSYLRTREGWTYLAVVVDVYTRRIVGWQLAGHMR